MVGLLEKYETDRSEDTEVGGKLVVFGPSDVAVHSISNIAYPNL